MSIKYKIFTEQHLLVDVLEDRIVLSDLEELFLKEIKDENFKEVHKVLSNVVNAKLDISMEEMQAFIQMMISPDPDMTFRWAILTKNPSQAALSYLIQIDQFFSQIVRVFSTLEACNKFLNISFEESGFEHDDYLILD